MNTVESDTTKHLNGAAPVSERASESNGKDVPMRLTQNNEVGTKTNPMKQENRTLAAYVGRPILVSEAQFKSVQEAHLTSMNLLDSSGNVLLRALDSMVPPEGSGRGIGEYTAQGMRQLAKSICDLVQTKTQVVRSMHQIARDEL